VLRNAEVLGQHGHRLAIEITSLSILSSLFLSSEYRDSTLASVPTDEEACKTMAADLQRCRFLRHRRLSRSCCYHWDFGSSSAVLNVPHHRFRWAPFARFREVSETPEDVLGAAAAAVAAYNRTVVGSGRPFSERLRSTELGY
jgi:hypothetical protein